MDDNAIRAKKYRERASEIRVIAEDLRSDGGRNLLRKIAKDYDRMADDLEATGTILPFKL